MANYPYNEFKEELEKINLKSSTKLRPLIISYKVLNTSSELEHLTNVDKLDNISEMFGYELDKFVKEITQMLCDKQAKYDVKDVRSVYEQKCRQLI